MKRKADKSMNVTGPNARELFSILAQLRHLYMHMMRHDDTNIHSMADGILSKQIKRLEGLQRTLFDKVKA